MQFLDKYVSHAVVNHHFMQWSKSNRTKTFLDKVTASDIAYTILVYENSNEVWKEELKIRLKKALEDKIPLVASMTTHKAANLAGD